MSNIFENTFKKHLKLMTEAINPQSLSLNEAFNPKPIEELFSVLKTIPGFDVKIGQRSQKLYDPDTKNYNTEMVYGVTAKYDGKEFRVTAGNTLKLGGTELKADTTKVVQGAKYIIHSYSENDIPVVTAVHTALKEAGFKLSPEDTPTPAFYSVGGASRSGMSPIYSERASYFGILELPNNQQAPEASVTTAEPKA